MNFTLQQPEGDFVTYLERGGVVDALTKGKFILTSVIAALYTEKDKPVDAIK